MSALNTINLNLIDEGRQAREAVCAGTPTPGELGELTSAGLVQVHGTASGINEGFFFRENQGTAKDITEDYVAGETCRFMKAWPGDEVYSFVADAVVVVANTTALVSNGDGTLKAAAGTETDAELVGIALESKTASGVERLKIRVL